VTIYTLTCVIKLDQLLDFFKTRPGPNGSAQEGVVIAYMHVNESMKSHEHAV